MAITDVLAGSSYMLNPGDPTNEAAKLRRRMAAALIERGTDFSPVEHWSQGAARVANALVGGLEMRGLDAAEKRKEKGIADTLAALPGLSGGVASDAPPVMPSAPASPVVGGDMNPAAKAIAGIESGGRYDALGPVTKTGDRAYGKFQVMGANIPAWSKAHLGREMTPEEFLRDPDAQEAVFKGQFGQYAQKYGPEGAARAWFAGEGGMNDLGRKDQLGTSVSAYADKFVKGGGAQMAALPDAGAPAAPAQAPAAPAGPQVAQAAPAAQAARAAPAGGIPAQEAAYIRALMANPATRQYGMQLYQAAVTRANQPQYGFQALPDGTIIRTDQRKGTVEPIYNAPTKPTFAEVGTDPNTGLPLKGFVDPNKREVQVYTPPAAQGAGPSTIPPVPPGVDPKVWREAQSKRATSDAMPGSDEDASKLRNEIQGLPSYKNLAQAAPVYKSMAQAAGRDTRAADVNMVYGLAKIMDPTSVVRESEMTIAQAVATLPQQLRAQIESQLTATGRLSPDVRAAIMQEAHSRIGSYKEMFDQDMGMYGGIADRRRFNRADVIPAFGPFDPWAPAAPLAAPGASPPAAPDRGAIEQEMRRRGLLK